MAAVFMDKKERAAILVELKKEKAAFPTIAQVLDAETCYEAMGLQQPIKGAPLDAEALRVAHARLLRELHPEFNPSRVAVIAHKRMDEAYAVLSDASMRSAYDASLERSRGKIAAAVARPPIWVTEKRAPSLSERQKLFEQQQPGGSEGSFVIGSSRHDDSLVDQRAESAVLLVLPQLAGLASWG